MDDENLDLFLPSPATGVASALGIADPAGAAW
jgi:hypothetical protein